MKEDSEKLGLKLNIQKTKIMASGPITSWQIYEETMEIVTDYFLGPKVTADETAVMKLRHLFLGEKSYDKYRQHIKNQRHYFADKCP